MKQKSIAISCTDAALEALAEVVKQIMVVKYHAPEDRPKRLDHRKKGVVQTTDTPHAQDFGPRSM